VVEKLNYTSVETPNPNPNPKVVEKLTYTSVETLDLSGNGITLNFSNTADENNSDDMQEVQNETPNYTLTDALTLTLIENPNPNREP